MSDASHPRDPLASELPRRDFLRLAGLGTGALLSGVAPLALEAQERPTFPVHTGRRPRGTRNNHVVVVGAGAWGAFIAWHLRKEGNKVTVLVDGKKVLEYVEPPGAQAGKEYERKLGEGTFCLQGHDPKSTIRYKNIRVKRL